MVELITNVNNAINGFVWGVPMLVLLVGTGLASSFPLWLYGKGITDLPLTLVGILQYIWPTTSLLMSIFVFREEVSTAKLICFGFIWVGLIIFTASKFIKPKGKV